jgi:poly-gamma-glutamate capsule biosynthesis protein CapA/YwtB (metallophosphatase superfamily)
VAVDPNYIPALAANGWDHAWSGLDGLFLQDDLTVINLECTPSDIGAPLDKDFTFRCPTDALPSLPANGIEVANLGNNHSGDYGKEALVDGRDQLVGAGVAPVGAGRNVTEAGEPAIFEVDGWKVAVVGFGGVAPDDSGTPRRTRQGCAAVMTRRRWSSRSRPLPPSPIWWWSQCIGAWSSTPRHAPMTWSGPRP